jgi:primosomal protein N' (replication factor Y)
VVAGAGGRLSVEDLQSLEVPRSTLNTLVKRGLVEIVEEPADRTRSKLKARPSPFNFQFNPAQQEALKKITEAVSAKNFSIFIPVSAHSSATASEIFSHS